MFNNVFNVNERNGRHCNIRSRNLFMKMSLNNTKNKECKRKHVKSETAKCTNEISLHLKCAQLQTLHFRN